MGFFFHRGTGRILFLSSRKAPKEEKKKYCRQSRSLRQVERRKKKDSCITCFGGQRESEVEQREVFVWLLSFGIDFASISAAQVQDLSNRADTTNSFSSSVSRIWA